MSSVAPLDVTPIAETPDPAPAMKRRGGTLYFVASLVSQVVALVRYVALARFLGPEQLGLAATLVVTQSFFDLISDTGSDRFLLQDRMGDTPQVQRLVQLVYAGRGTLVGIALVVFAIPIAAFYKEPQLAVGIAFLALSPFITGFVNLDYRRVQRSLDFRPESVSMIICELTSLVVTVVAAWITRDFTAILYGLVARALMLVTITHILAKRPYRLGWDREAAPRLSRFAAPLMLSGIMIFFGLVGDRVVVANQLGAKALGQYSATLLLIYTPAAVILRYMHVLYLPMVASGRDDPALRDKVSETLGGQTFLLAISMAVGFAIVAPTFVTILYGHRFAQSAIIVAFIGILQTTRFLLNWPATVALSIGRNKSILASTVLRLLAFPFAILGARFIGGLSGVVLGFTAGELTSVALAVALLNRNLSRPMFMGYDRLVAFVLASCAIVAWNVALSHRSLLWGAVLIPPTAGLCWWIVRREWVTITDAADHGLSLSRSMLSRVGVR